MKDIGIIGSADGPTSIFVSSENENLSEDIAMINIQESPPVEKEYQTIEEKLNAKTLAENLDSGIKIMGLGMVAVFGVLTVLYIIVKIMGLFAKGKDKDEKN